MTIHRLESAVGTGMIATAGFHRPPELLPPNFMMLQLHTTGLKSRAVGHQNEVAAWSLMTPNKNWRSFRSNRGIRTCTNAEVAGNVEINNFYPAGIRYVHSRLANPTIMQSESSCHLFSWVNPNWAYTGIRHYGHDDAGTTIQDMRFSIVTGDTLEPATMFSGSPTQLTLVLSP